MSKGAPGLTKAALARRWRVSVRSIERMVESGLPRAIRGRGGRPDRFDPEAAGRWRATQQAGRLAETVTLAQARTRKELALAAKHEMENRRRAGELLEAIEAEAVWSEQVLAAREHLLAIPETAAARGIVAPEQVEVLTGLIHDALRELNGGHRGGA